MLTEDANRKSIPLWERYLAFEFEMGDLQTALRLEKRAREALGDSGGAGKAVQLLLLRYEFLDIWPCSADERQYLQYIMGRGPPPPGYERKRGTASETGDAAAKQDAANVTFSGMPKGRDSADPYNRPLTAVVANFLNSLPPPQLLDGPMPDVDVVVEAFLNTDLTPAAVQQILLAEGVIPAGNGQAGSGSTPDRPGVKRELDADEDDDGIGQGTAPVRDIFRMRVKQRARVGTAADG